MNIKKIFERLLIFFVGLPCVLFIAIFKWQHHILLHIALIAVSGIAAAEMYDILSYRSKMINKVFLIILTMLIPASAVLCSFFHFPTEIITFSFIIVFLIILATEILSPKFEDISEKNDHDDHNVFKNSNSRISSSVLVLLYAGFLLTFLSRMTLWQYSSAYIFIFLLMVFICDSFAWLFGMLFGKSNRGVFKASPNKSIVGFVFGILGSALSGYIGYIIWPQVFTGSVYKILIIGLLVSLAGIIGDLVESVIKRSAEKKDSGSIILGRGGILDSIDSVLISAPIYYFLIELLYGL